VRARWFDQRREQCERRAGRRGEAHGTIPPSPSRLLSIFKHIRHNALPL